MARLFQRPPATVGADDEADDDEQDDFQQPPQPPLPPADEPEPTGALLGRVQIEFLEGLDVIIVRGHPRDVERVIEIIEQIEQLAAITDPRIELIVLEHANNLALAEMVSQVYDQTLLARHGRVSITPLAKPNALLLIGRADGVEAVLDLARRLDQPVDPATQLRVFPLRHAAAFDVKAAIDEFFAARPGLGPRVLTTADFRSNALVVQAGPRDMQEVDLLIQRLDTPTSESVNELRVFKLQNSLAEELAPVIQQAIISAQVQPGLPGAPPTPAAPPAPPVAPGQQARIQQARSAMLRFLTIDARGERRLRSGILTDVRITADPRGNALIVSAPTASIGLIGALIHELDQLPAAEAQLKVFTIVNGDAASLVQMLEGLFAIVPRAPGPAAIVGPVGQEGVVRLRFSVDQRTNSIIASGSASDLAVVEALLLRLDASDVRQRRHTVYRLKNSPAIDVANAVNDLLRSERQVQLVAPGLLSPFEQIEREVVVVPEPVSNSLIVSATPRYFEEIRQLVEQLDARPPMVMIQVVIAEVALSNFDEFGVELGIQDSLLFDRSLLGDLLTTQTVTTESTPAGVVTVQQETIQAATITPGFNFINQPLGNSGSDRSLATREHLAGQALSHFAVGRINPELGYGGMVLSAASESVNILIRALQERRRLDVLSRPQIMTLDNQPAFIQVGQRVPRITGTQINQVGQVNTVQLENVGLILGVTPRISPDGLVVMEIDAEKSEVGPEAEGVPVSISATGEVIRSPRINTTTAQTTVSAVSGQTVVLGGLITKNTSEIQRRVPLLSDIPILGHLFRFDSFSARRTELLIIMTPIIVRSERDAEMLKQVESARMHWVLADVMEMHGDAGLRSRCDEWGNHETEVVYPDLHLFPLGEEVIVPPAVPGEALPAPGVPAAPPALLPPQDRPPYPAPQSLPPLPGPAPPLLEQPLPEREMPLGKGIDHDIRFVID